MSTDAMWINAGLAEQLYATLHRCGTVTIRLADLGRYAGLTTDFDKGEIAVDATLDFPTFRGTVTHELTHLRRGPVPEYLADAEEVAVRHETAEVLVPALRYASRHPEIAAVMTEERLQEFAARAQVDIGVVRDGASPPTMPLPIVASDEKTGTDAA